MTQNETSGVLAHTIEVGLFRIPKGTLAVIAPEVGHFRAEFHIFNGSDRPTAIFTASQKDQFFSPNPVTHYAPFAEWFPDLTGITKAQGFSCPLYREGELAGHLIKGKGEELNRVEFLDEQSMRPIWNASLPPLSFFPSMTKAQLESAAIAYLLYKDSHAISLIDFIKPFSI